MKLGVPGSQRWIWVCGWEKFQHYKDRNPHWIKFYTELLHDEDYLDLSSHTRSVLHGVWLAFASSHRQLRADPTKLSKRLNTRVKSSDLVSLNQAGFLLFVDSDGLADCEQMYSTVLARRSQKAIPEAEADTEEDTGSPRTPLSFAALPYAEIGRELERITRCCSDADEKSMGVLSRESVGLPLASVAKVRESCEGFDGRVGVGYAVNALRSERAERAV